MVDAAGLHHPTRSQKLGAAHGWVLIVQDGINADEVVLDASGSLLGRMQLRTRFGCMARKCETQGQGGCGKNGFHQLHSSDTYPREGGTAERVTALSIR